MTQTQLDLICKIISNGAPALAGELCGALESFLKSYAQLSEEVVQLRAELSELKSAPEDCERT